MKELAEEQGRAGEEEGGLLGWGGSGSVGGGSDSRGKKEVELREVVDPVTEG